MKWFYGQNKRLSRRLKKLTKKAWREGRVYTKIGIGIGNVASIHKLQLLNGAEYGPSKKSGKEIMDEARERIRREKDGLVV